MSASPITLADFPEVHENVDRTFQTAMIHQTQIAVHPRLAKVTSTDMRTTTYHPIAGTTFAKRRNEGDSMTFDSPVNGLDFTFTQQEIALGIQMTKQMRLFARDGGARRLMQETTNQTHAAAARIELDVAHMYTFMFDTSYTNLDGETISTVTNDGLAVISASHTTTAAGSTTYSNRISSLDGVTVNPKFGRDGLLGAIKQSQTILDDNDLAIVGRFDTIVTTQDPEVVDQVQRVLQTTDLPGSADNDTNAYVNGKRFKHVIVPLLDTTGTGLADTAKKDQWAVIDSDAMQKDYGASILFSQQVALEKPEQVFETGTWKWGVTALYDMGVITPRYIVASKGTETS